MHRSLSALAFVVLAGTGALSGCADVGLSEGPLPEETVSEDWSLTDSDLRELYSAFVEQLREKYGLQEAVGAEFVRFVSAGEWATAQVACLAAEGIPATANHQGGVTYGDIPVEQGPAQVRASAECEAQYPLDPRYNMRLPTKRAEAQYDFLVDSLGPCVEELGYSISGPPSKETWLDEYYTMGRSWDPFAEAAQQMSAESSSLDELYQRCPPVSLQVYPSFSQ